jgi:NADPH:quinone reductase-like Zn-dependent oxidoreductase
MKALRKEAKGTGHVELCEVAVPEIGTGEVLMKV